MTDTTFNDAVKAISSVLSTKQNAIEWQTAMLGDGHGTVIATQDNTVYCRLTHNSSVIEVINYRVAPVDGLLVRIAKTPEMPNHWQVIGQADQRVDEGNSTVDGGVIYNTPNHHRLHEYLGVDQVNVDWRQINTLKVYPYSGMTIGVIAGLIPRTGADIVVPTQTLDLTSHVPTTGALYALISVDSSGTLAVTDGTAVSGLLSLTLSDIPDTPTGNFRLAAVRLYSGQTSISESLNTNDIRDLRWPQERLASGIGVDDLPTPIDIPHGGTSATTASAAINNLLPTQVGQAGNGLLTDGSNPYWGPTGGGGSGTIVITSLPVGTIVPFGGTSIPSGWLECDGSAVSRTTYADLFTIVGTTYGIGDGSTTFNLPDLRGRVSIGKGTGSGLTARTIGATGGTETHTLSTAEIPSHSHTYVGLTTYGAGVIGSVVANVDASTNISTSAAGGGGAHNNMQPFVVTAYIIKYTDTATSSLIFDDGATPENVTLTAATGDDVYAARRDHVHAVDQSIAPTWTATHSWTNDSDTAHAMYLYRGDDPTVHGPAFAGFRAYGTLASPSDAGINAVFARFSGRGRGSGAWPASATGRLDIAATEAQTSTAQGTDIRLYTTPNGSTTIGLAATFGQDKSLAVVGAISASNYAGTVSGNGTLSTGGFTLTISGNSTINGSLVGNITGGGTLATGGFTLTVPATGTAALINYSNAGYLETQGTLRLPATSSATVGVINIGGSRFAHNYAHATATGRNTWLGIGSGNFTLSPGGGAATLASSNTAIGYTILYSLTTGYSNVGIGANTLELLSTGFQNMAIGTLCMQTTTNAQNCVAIGTQAMRFGGGASNVALGVSALSAVTGSFNMAVGSNTLQHLTSGTDNIAIGQSAGTNTGTNLTDIANCVFIGSSANSSVNSVVNSIAIGYQTQVTKSNLAILGNASITETWLRGNVGIAETSPAARLHVTLNNATTNAVDEITRITHNSTGTAAAGLGGSIALNLESSTTADQAAATIKWLWTTATHASRKAKMQLAVNDTAERLGLAIEADGAAADVYFEGGAGSGFPYGGCYGNDINWTQASAAQNTWYIVSDADMTDSSGGLNLVTHDGSGKLTVTKAGRYRISYGATVGCSVANKLIQTTVSVNGTAVNDGIQHVIMNATANMVSASTAILSLAASDFVEFVIRTTDTGTPDISVEHLNITLVQVGG